MLFALQLCQMLMAEIPIIAFCGIPAEHSSAERFREFRNCGFDISIENYGDMNGLQLKAILDVAQREHVRLIVRSAFFDTRPGTITRHIKGHPALYAYYLEDEPVGEALGRLARKVKAMRVSDDSTRYYVNLMPTYGIENHDKRAGAYKRYLQQVSALNLHQISFDHYPICDDGIRKDWYRNLELVRRESMRTNRSFWAFVLCTPHIYYPQPTLASLRLQIYSNLVYGAQAIQYFTYWTPHPYGDYDFHDGPIGLDGKRTKTYMLVKNMNQELRRQLSLFDGATIESVGHLIDIPDGTTKAANLPRSIKRLRVKGKKGCIVSVVRKNNHQYLAIVNKDLKGKLTLNIKTDEGAVLLDKQLRPQPLKSMYRITAGDMLIIQLP